MSKDHEKIHREILHEAIHDKREPRVWPPWLRQSIAALVLIAFVMFYFFGSSISDIVNSMIFSKNIDQDILEQRGIRIEFKEGLLEHLQAYYIEHQEREIKACLGGERTGTTYYLSNITFPRITSANVVHITTARCPQGTLVDLHSHPTNRCIPSDQDIKSLRAQQDENPELIMMVMCTTTRFYLAR